MATGSGERTFQVELADDARERSRGLMYRRSMPKDEGMLFDFGKEQPVGFWMANTYIPLDMLFIKADGTVEFDRRAHDADVAALDPVRRARSATCWRSTGA